MELKNINEGIYLVISNEAYEDKDYVAWLEENHDEAVVSEDFYERALALNKKVFSVSDVIMFIEHQIRKRELNNKVDKATTLAQLKLLKMMILGRYNSNDEAIEHCNKSVNESFSGDILNYKNFADLDWY